MKYLISFSENSQLNLKEYCEMYLVYLSDRGFLINVAFGIITITKRDNSEFKWDSIKDSFIPFLYVLNNDFTIYSNGIRFFLPKIYRHSTLYPTISQALDDNLKKLIPYDKVRNLKINKIIISIDI